MIREYRRQGETAEFNFEEVKTYLLGKGYVIGAGGIGTGVDGLVRADIDANVPKETWEADMEAFVPSPDPRRLIRAYFLGRWRALDAKTPAQRQAATATEQDLYMLLRLLKQDG